MSYDRETLIARLRHHEPTVRNNAVYDAAAEIERLRAALVIARKFAAWPVGPAEARHVVETIDAVLPETIP